MSVDFSKVALTTMYSVFDYTLQQEGVYIHPISSERLNDIYVSKPINERRPVIMEQRTYRVLTRQEVAEELLRRKIEARIDQLFRSNVIGFLGRREGLLSEIIERVYNRISLLRDPHPMLLKHKKDSIFKNSIVVDPQKELFYLFLKKKEAQVGLGSFKHVVKAIVIPFSCRKVAFFAARKINQIKIPSEKNTLILSDPLEEARLSLQYSCVPKVYFAAMHPLKGGRIDDVEELYSSLFDAIEGQVLNDDELLKVALDLFFGLVEFHRSGLVHMDVELSNALFKKDKTQINAVWTDLGMAVRLGHVVGKKASPLVVGIYGRFGRTPPEGFNGVPFTGDVFKLDSWAFGICLYELFFSNSPNWIEILGEHYEKNVRGRRPQVFVLPNELRQEFMSQLDQERLFIINACNIEKKPLKKAFLKICSRLLEKDPSVRWSLEQVDIYLQSVEQIYPISISASRSAPVLVRKNRIVKVSSL